MISISRRNKKWHSKIDNTIEVRERCTRLSVPTAKKSAKSLSNPGKIVRCIAGIVFQSTKIAVVKKRCWRNPVFLSRPCRALSSSLRIQDCGWLCGRRPGLRHFMLAVLNKGSSWLDAHALMGMQRIFLPRRSVPCGRQQELWLRHLAFCHLRSRSCCHEERVFAEW